MHRRLQQRGALFIVRRAVHPTISVWDAVFFYSWRSNSTHTTSVLQHALQYVSAKTTTESPTPLSSPDHTHSAFSLIDLMGEGDNIWEGARPGLVYQNGDAEGSALSNSESVMAENLRGGHPKASSSSQRIELSSKDTDIRRVVPGAVSSSVQSSDSDLSCARDVAMASGNPAPLHTKKKTYSNPTPPPLAAVDYSIFKVHTADCFGMPTELPSGAPRTLEELLEMSPSVLRQQLQDWIGHMHWRELTPVQQAAIPFALEFRDVLCIAPTATGKTFSYVFPTMLRLLLDDTVGRGNDGATRSPSSNTDEDSDVLVDLNRRDVEVLLRDQINKGKVCRYCELDVRDNRFCSMTGLPHAPPPNDDDLPLNARVRRPMRLEELNSVGEPRVLVLVPTSQLAIQVYRMFRQLHCSYTIRYMVRASSADEQQKLLRALDGVDVLISAPETILPALYKQKLSLKRVKVLIVDEVDDIVSTNHFEPLKIILGALPKRHARPQRLLFGASLPVVAYQMTREKMLLPSHRFVLADVKMDSLGYSVASGPSQNYLDCLRTGASRALVTANATVTHVVFMLGRIEKASKLAWLYQSGKLTSDQRTLVFCNSRHNVAYVHDHLQRLVPSLRLTTLTSRASATAQEGVLKMFSSGVSTCLICTDLLSRGIDFKGVVYVVHYDMPLNMESWVHRNGRCGRYGLPGYAYTFFQPENIKLAKPLVAYLRQHKQLVPPKLQEYARQSFVDVFRNSLFHHPTRPSRRDDPQNTTPVLGHGTPRFPDYRQDSIQKNFRPL